MYRTCLFCHGDLGSNDLIEELPVGRRVAFDPGKGRLWVVCRRCERWNLTPFDERWEALERCEKLFRGTRRRRSTDQIGLARLAEGLELVRIGEPLRPEFAAWRYGDQFGRRARRHMIFGTGGSLILGAGAFAPLAVSGLGLLISIAHLGYSMHRGLQVVARIDRGGGALVPIRRQRAKSAVISPETTPDNLVLEVPTGARTYDPNWVARGHAFRLEGSAAQAALRLLMPVVNEAGAGKGAIRRAAELLDEVGKPDRFLGAATTAAGKGRLWMLRTLGRLDDATRLAVEMATQEESEQRWLDGELAALELAWRDAEAIAAIADGLAVPEAVEQQFPRLRRTPPPG